MAGRRAEGRAHCRGEGGCQRGDMAGRRAAGAHTLRGRGGVSEGGHGRP